MGFKYGSTWDEKVKATMIAFYEKLLPEKQHSRYQKLCSIAGKNTVHTCLNACVSAMALVSFLGCYIFFQLMTGSGDIQMIQIFRKVRNFKQRYSQMVKDNSLHSTHVTTNMALGMLVMGNAR